MNSGRIARALILLLVLTGGVSAQDGFDRDATLPLTPDVHYGVLENGLTYYIQHHEQPADRVEMQLALRVGALQETEEQLGLAHFLEHMMFNGTESFPANELVDFFELNGMEFGPDLNAFTSHEATVYQLSIDTTNPELYDTAWDVLLDWAVNATLDPVEVEKEVGVIVEEWRQRQQNASGRINEKAWPVILGEDSRYVTRDIIGGDMSVVESAPTDELRNFYETWYRPELMAVIIVGDVDVADAEERIREHFGPLSSPPDAPMPQQFDNERHSDTRVGVITDPELPVTAVQLFRKVDGTGLVTLGDYRDLQRDSLFYSMLNERLQERQRKADAPFLQASAFGGSTLGNVAVHGFTVYSTEDGVIDAVAAVLDELDRVRRDGFTEGELTDARADRLQFYENALEEKEFRENTSIASEYRRHFLEDEISPGIEVELELVNDLLPQLTLETMNELSGLLLEPEERVLLLFGPERSLDVLPGEQALLDQLDATRDVAAYAEIELVETLLEMPPEPAAIVAEQDIEGAEWPLTEWTFANGVRLLLMPTDLAEREVSLSGLSPGGTGLFSDEEYLGATFANSVVQQSGVGNVSQDQLERFLSGRTVSAGLSLSGTHERVSGFANNDELETLFQLVYLYLTQPQLDEGAFEAARARGIDALKNRDLDPIVALTDAINKLMTYGNPSPRYRPATVAEMEALDSAEAFDSWRARWQEAGDFTFALVGSFEHDDVRELAQRYLGNLPTSGGTEEWVDRTLPFPNEIREQDVYAGIEEQVIFLLAYGGAFTGDQQDSADMVALGDVVDQRFTEDLREDLSGAYSPYAGASVNEIPNRNFLLQGVAFTNPEKYEALRAAAFAILHDLRENGPTEEEVEGVRAQRINNIEEAREQNGYWLGALRRVIIGLEENYGYTKHSTSRWEDLTPEAIQEQAGIAIRDDAWLFATLFPEALDPDYEGEAESTG